MSATARIPKATASTHRSAARLHERCLWMVSGSVALLADPVGASACSIFRDCGCLTRWTPEARDRQDSAVHLFAS